MRHPLTIYAIVMLHLSWGIFLLLEGGPIAATAIDGIVRFFQPYTLAGGVLIFGGICGIIGIRLFERYPIVSLALFMPMQFLLLFSELTIIQAIFRSHFADGVIRSREFIATDQIYIIIIGLLYTYVLMVNYGSTKLLKSKWNG